MIPDFSIVRKKEDKTIKKYKEAIKYLSKNMVECNNDSSLVTSEAVETHNISIALAIEVLEKQVPKRPKIENWCPAYCPSCGKKLSDSVGDGYYKHYYSLKMCDCGQQLDWV